MVSWVEGPSKFKREYTMQIFFYRENKKRERERERGRKGGGNEKRFILIFCQSALEI